MKMQIYLCDLQLVFFILESGIHRGLKGKNHLKDPNGNSSIFMHRALLKNPNGNSGNFMTLAYSASAGAEDLHHFSCQEYRANQ